MRHSEKSTIKMGFLRSLVGILNAYEVFGKPFFQLLTPNSSALFHSKKFVQLSQHNHFALILKPFEKRFSLL